MLKAKIKILKTALAVSTSAVFSAAIVACGYFETKLLLGIDLKDAFDDEKFGNFSDSEKTATITILVVGIGATFGSISLGGAYGWKLGEWLCKKIGLED